MASVESSSKICALCTKCTGYSIHSILEGEGEGDVDGGGELLQKLTSEFNLLPTQANTSSPSMSALIDNWSLCPNCLPNVQSAVQSKGKVDRLEGDVRKLQLELLRQLEKLKEEVHQMEGHLRKINQTVLDSPPPLKSTESDSTIGIFHQKIITVVRDLQSWQVSTSKKLLQNLDTLKSEEEPPYIKEEEPEDESSAEPPADLLPNYDDNYLDNLAPGQHWLFFNDDPNPTPNPPKPPPPPPTFDPEGEAQATSQVEEPPKKLRRSAAAKTFTKKYYETDSSSSAFEDDPDFDPSDLTIAKPLSYDLNKKLPTLPKHLSTFRRSLISRVRSRNTTSTSSTIPLYDKSDPRRPFAIKYFDAGCPVMGKRNKFFLAKDHEIICLDDEQALKCGTCDYKVELVNLTSKWNNIEDNLFEHILSKHLKLYTCLECGISYESWKTLKGHRLTHLGREERAKFFCEICGKPMIRENSLKQHKWTHLSEEEKRDEGNWWMMPYGVKKMMEEREEGMRFQCATCGMELKTEFNLRVHERTHLGVEEREDEMVVCTECGVKMLRTNLKRHRRRRHGGKGGWVPKKRGRKPNKKLGKKVC